MQYQKSIARNFPNITSLGRITTPYGGKTAYEEVHPGVDIANVKGTPIPAPVSGRVIDSVGGKMNGDEGFGNMVTIQTQNGDKVQLGHLDQNNLKKGQTVQEGQQIGTMGNSGSAYSPSRQGDGTHLDIRIVSAYGKYKNPLTYLKSFNK